VIGERRPAVRVTMPWCSKKRGDGKRLLRYQKDRANELQLSFRDNPQDTRREEETSRCFFAIISHHTSATTRVLSRDFSENATFFGVAGVVSLL
jgi:hypothetical protein